MAPLSLPQPLNRQPEEGHSGHQPVRRRPTLVVAPDPSGAPDGSGHPGRLPGADHHRAADLAHSTRPPGGERPGRLPGPEGPDRLASGFAPPHRTHTFDLPSAPASVGAARRSVGEVLTSWGTDDDLNDSAVLVTSELVTNALTHSGSERIVCRLHGAGSRIRIEVEDQNRGHRLPAPRRPGPEEQSGRGLFLVEALSHDWGVVPVPHRPGRVVWAELTTAPDASAVAPVPESPTRPVPHSAEGQSPHDTSPYAPQPHP